MHDLLAFADLFVGEGATMAAESAVLGTPAIYVNTLTMGYTDELDERYELLFNYQQEDRHERALEKAVSILEEDTDWQRRRERLLDDKIDTTDVVLHALTGQHRDARGRTTRSGAEV
jgi:predicted glycosyltransferase